MTLELRDSPFDPYAELQAYQVRQARLAGQAGATSIFIGTMRDFNAGDTVRAMHLEHYPGMTELELSRILEEARENWGLLDALVIHRVGDILPGQPIVLVAAWSAHRREAFEAARYLMESLKHRAPFWKRETLDNGPRWVECNTPG